MGYTKQNFADGQTLKAEHLIKMEEGIINAEKSGGSGTVDTSGLQEKLVSGTNIKTINGQSLLGSGDIAVEGGSAVASVAINYDQNVKAINHRGYSKGAPENTIPAYILSKQNGFTYVECDVSFTADNVAVLLHDSTIDRTSDGTGNIADLTYADTLKYDFGSWFSSAYTGVKIPTFTEFMMTCKGLGLHPYIELKTGGGYTQEQILQVVNEVALCGMRGKVTYISFKLDYLQWVKECDSEARLGYVVNSLNETIVSQAVSLQTDSNEVFIDTQLSYVKDETVALCIEHNIPVEVWTVNSANFIKSMHRYISGVTSDNLIAGKVLYEKYSTYTPPEVEAVPTTSVAVSPTSLIFDSLEPQQLTATVEPSDTTDALIWSSSDEGVASVSGGLVSPLSKGECTITATSGSYSATASVSVTYEVPSYSISRNLVNCTSTSSAVKVVEGNSHTETVSADKGYTLEGATVVVTMGGADISDKFVNGTLTVESVTGDVVIEVTAVEIVIDMPQPVVDWTLTNVTDGKLVNTGSGGATYDATISGGEYSSDSNGLSLMTNANAKAPFALSGSKNFTLCVRGRFDELSSSGYQRMFRDSGDALCVFYAKSGSVYQAKLVNIASPAVEKHSDLIASVGKSASFSSTFDATQLHTYVMVGDVASDKVLFYIDGELVASQSSFSTMSASSDWGIGNTQGSGNCYANKLTFTKFQIYDQALTAEEVAVL